MAGAEYIKRVCCVCNRKFGCKTNESESKEYVCSHCPFVFVRKPCEGKMLETHGLCSHVCMDMMRKGK